MWKADATALLCGILYICNLLALPLTKLMQAIMVECPLCNNTLYASRDKAGKEILLRNPPRISGCSRYCRRTI